MKLITMANTVKIGKIPLRAIQEQDSEEMVHNFNEVLYGFTPELAIIRVRSTGKMNPSELELENVL